MEKTKKTSTRAVPLQTVVPNVEPLVTTVQVCEYLQLTPRSLQVMRDKGKIPFRRLNARTFRYRLSEVAAALAK